MKDLFRFGKLAVACVIAGATLLSTGCRDDSVAGPEVGISTSNSVVSRLGVELPAIQPGDSSAAASLARVVALALADPPLRAQILEDMRDSPFPNHAIHLPSYLAGSRGRAVALAAAQRGGIAIDQLHGLGEVRGGLQLVMRRPMDRASWTGSDDIVVLGVASTVKERLGSRPVSFGYDVRGRAVAIPILAAVPFPFIVIEPRSKSFGADPEAARRAASRRTSSTVSTREEELAAMYVPPSTMSGPDSPECDPQTVIIECSDESGGGTGPFPGSYLPSGYTFSSCRPSGGVGDPTLDRDNDGLVDQCEFELADAFSPQLQFDSGDCDIGREPYWAANYQISPIDGVPVIRVFYAISYYTDCGVPNIYCQYNSNCYGHVGDSEFIIAEVSTNGAKWVLRRATLSAHWNSDGSDDGVIYAAGDLEFDGDGSSSRPVIWVAEGKHANYRSQAHCEGGAFFNLDRCDTPGSRLEVEVLPNANLGNSGNEPGQSQIIFGNVGSRTGRPGNENFWSTTYFFLGWWNRPENTASNTTAYGKSLEFFGF